MASEKNHLGCGVCGKLLPSSQFPKKLKASDIRLPQIWLNSPCMDCIEIAKKAVLKQIKETRQEAGYTIHTLAPADLGTSFDIRKTAFNMQVSYKGKKC